MITPITLTDVGNGILSAQLGPTSGAEKWSPLDDLRFGDSDPVVALAGTGQDEPAGMGIFVPGLLGLGQDVVALGLELFGLGAAAQAHLGILVEEALGDGEDGGFRQGEFLAEAGIEVEEGELILRRINTADGRKTAWVNDRRVTGEVLRDLSDALVELHGQHDDRGLLNPRGHRQLLDAFAGLDLAGMLGDGKLSMALVDAVPAGQYGKAALESLGIWGSVEASVAQSDNVRAALVLVSTGEAPYGIVYASDAVADDGVTVVGRFPAESHPPIVYPAALLTGAADAADRAVPDGCLPG